MKKIFFISFCLFIIIFNINCVNDPAKINGQYIQLKDGRIFRFEAGIGDTYLLYAIDTAQIKLK
jgi:hypothetical protein